MPVRTAATTTLALDELSILDAVRQVYDDVATCPTKEFHFPTGRAACLYVGYPESEIDAIPETAVESFAGVGYPFLAPRGLSARTLNRSQRRLNSHDVPTE